MRLERHLELGAAHRELVELIRHALLQPPRRLRPNLAELRRQIGAITERHGKLRLEPVGLLARALDRIDLAAAVLCVGEHRLDRSAVLAL